MNFEFKQFDELEIIQPSEVHRMNVELINLSSSSAALADEYFTPSSYMYTIDEGVILGNRSCLVKDTVFLDTPAEWRREEFLSYITRVRKVHNREFAFVRSYSDELGEGQLIHPRPYMHIAEDVFFCGSVEFWNFGFFLTVLMQKVFLAASIDRSRPILVPICASWQVILLRTFFPRTKFIFYDPAQVISVSKATVLGWPGFGFHVCKEYVTYLRENLNSLQQDGAVDRQLLYFVRRDGMFAKRFAMVDLMNSFLLSRGYTPIQPELLSPSRVARMINASKSVVLDSGSALFNLIFAGSDTQVTLFESRNDFLLNHARFINSCETKKARIFYVDSESALSDVKQLI